jgi:photosystem II stability/assembly factor-like uncharacterized protein
VARLYASTGDGIARLDENNGAWTVALSLEGTGAQCLAVDPNDANVVYAGLRERGVRRTSDGGVSWVDCELPAPGVFSVAVSAADGAVYAGNEPSALFRSDDGGMTWRELTALLELPSRPTWSFPPRPWTSHVRWIAPNPHDPDLLLVGIELGGLMRSVDGGGSWEDHRPGAQRDVHSLAWHPQIGGRAYEAGGGGAAWSDDGGKSWHAAETGLDRHYTWSVAVEPGDPDVWYVSASTGPFAAHGGKNPEARIYAWREGTWHPLSGGLPEPLPAMPYALVSTERRLFAGLADGQLWASMDRGETWHPSKLEGDRLPRINALVAASV